MCENALITRQNGVAVLSISLIVLFLITMVTFYANKGAVFEQKMSGSQLSAYQAFELAQGGINYASAWMATTGNYAGVAWVADTSNPPYTQKNMTAVVVPSVPAGSSVAVTLWKNSSVVEVSATASGPASSNGTVPTATVKQAFKALALTFNVPSLPPMVVNGCVSNVTGSPSVNPNAATGSPVPAVAILSSADPACIDPGNFNLSGGTVVGNGFTGTAWDYTFGISKADMLALATAQAGGATGGPIYYYTSPSDPFHTDLGDSNNPVILIFDVGAAACPKMNGGVTIYGIVYCSGGLDMQGWGAAAIHGSLITDAPITKYTANAQIENTAFTNDPAGGFNSTPVVSTIIGTWRDF